MDTNGIVTISSFNSVDQTVDNLVSILRAKEIKIFAVIDHGAEAKRAGIKMRPAKLVIFGNPHASTPLMRAVPTSALDLPLKILVWQQHKEGDSRVWISFNSPAYLQERHDWPVGLLQNIKMVASLARQASEQSESSPAI